MSKLIENDITYRRWEAAEPKAALLLVHGLGAHTARWQFLGEHFLGRGISSYALELRGFGKTKERPRGHVDSFRIYDRDILTLREIIDKELPGRKVFLLGESLGGLLAFNLAALHPRLFAGQILISPVFKSGLKFPLSAYLTLAANILIRPRKMMSVPFTSAMCTRDEAYRQIMDDHPDELREASLKLLLNTLTDQRKAKKTTKTHGVPALFLVAGQDKLVDERAERKIFKALAVGDKTLHHYPEMHHALSIELGRERIFRDIEVWIEKRI